MFLYRFFPHTSLLVKELNVGIELSPISSYTPLKIVCLNTRKTTCDELNNSKPAGKIQLFVYGLQSHNTLFSNSMTFFEKNGSVNISTYKHA